MKAIKRIIKNEPLVSLIIGGLFIIMILSLVSIYVIPDKLYFDGSVHTHELIVYGNIAISIIWVIIANFF